MSKTNHIKCKECDAIIDYTPGDSDVSGSFELITTSHSRQKKTKQKGIYLTCENDHTHKYFI